MRRPRLISLLSASLFLVIIMFVFLSVPPSLAQPVKVEEISKLKVYVFVGETAHVKADMTIKNLASSPLVPGIGEIRLQKKQPSKIWIFSIPATERREPVNVLNVKAYSGDKIFKTYVEKKDDYTVIYYEVWYPIQPGKTINLTIEYDADLVEKGILFKTITLPIGADVDIKDLEIVVNSDWHLCFADPPMEGSWKAQLPANHLTFFTAEFSVIPLPQLPVRGYILFWGSVLLLLSLLIVGVVIKKRGGRKEIVEK
jgi:hypothetical protein